MHSGCRGGQLPTRKKTKAWLIDNLEAYNAIHEQPVCIQAQHIRFRPTDHYSGYTSTTSTKHFTRSTDR